MTHIDFTSASEQAFFRQVVRDYYKGGGFIVDAGCFLGGSTLSLCEGVDPSILEDRLNRGMKTVIAMDRFLATDPYVVDALTMRGRDIRFGESFLDVFLDRLNVYLPYIDVRSGDVHQIGRLSVPIEVLFIDVAKSPGLNAYILKSWFPLLEVGSVVIQQDFYTPAQPWVAATMGMALDHFDLLAPRVGETASFILKKPLQDASLRSIGVRAGDPAMRLQAFDRLLEIGEYQARYPLLMMKAVALSEIGFQARAAKALDAAYESFASCEALGSQLDDKAVNWFAMVEGVIRPTDVKVRMQSEGDLRRHALRIRTRALTITTEASGP
ncbi:hypothetical protein [Luteibacter sp. 22Crub2.1]|uniref:hypothetical protein n=1 Tax=Luteibacter sp. 22Crub2.1 TaxID=1283288 RepID=UPI0009A5C7F7|nr:hypothetical protein [Luteibacter sp. 22Crub2.1]SKB59262.1 hypothetical protein SAMN05660880_01739 [Luteibacter sp. 22Crub2.1]